MMLKLLIAEQRERERGRENHLDDIIKQLGESCTAFELGYMSNK